MQQGKLLTVGEDGEGLRNLQLKAWAAEGLRPGAAPSLLELPCRLLPAAPKVAPSAAGASEGVLAAVALRCTDWPSVAVAVGLSNGTVHILRADAAKAKATAPVPAAQLRDAGGSLSALHFAVAAAAGPGLASGAAGAAGGAAELHLFAVGPARLAAFDVRTGHRLLEDECGCRPGCSAVSAWGELMVAAPEAVFFYTGGRVPAALCLLDMVPASLGCPTCRAVLGAFARSEI